MCTPSRKRSEGRGENTWFEAKREGGIGAGSCCITEESQEILLFCPDQPRVGSSWANPECPSALGASLGAAVGEDWNFTGWDEPGGLFQLGVTLTNNPGGNQHQSELPWAAPMGLAPETPPQPGRCAHTTPMEVPSAGPARQGDFVNISFIWEENKVETTALLLSLMKPLKLLGFSQLRSRLPYLDFWVFRHQPGIWCSLVLPRPTVTSSAVRTSNFLGVECIYPPRTAPIPC